MSYSDATLKKMAGLRGLKPAARCLLQADLFQAIHADIQKIDQLSDVAADVLNHVLSNGNGGDWFELQEEFDLNGDNRDDPQDAILEADSRKDDPVAVLLAKGFLAPDPTTGEWDSDWKFFIPLELVSAIRQALEFRATRMPNMELGPASAPGKTISCAESLWPDLWRIVVASLSVPIERTQSGSPAVRSVKKLSRLLGLEPQSLDCYLSFLNEYQALAGRRRLSPSAALLQDPRQAFEALAAGYPSWLRTIVFYENGEWRIERYRSDSRMPALRAALIEALAAVRQQWSRTDDLLNVILADPKRAAAIKRDHYGLDYCSQSAAKRRLRKSLTVELNFLCRFGVVETDESGSVARPTSWLDDTLAKRSPLLPAEIPAGGDRPRLIVQPNLEALAPPGTPFKTYKVLSDFGELTSVDRMAVYAFSLQSLQRGIERHGDTRLLEDALGRDSPLPHAFSMLVQEAGSRAGELLFLPCSYIVRARQPHLGKLLETLSSAKPLEGAPGHYLLADDGPDVEALMKALKKKGYFPLMRREPAPDGARHDDD
ncbi:MAG: hypothetical protein HKL90_09325 [Elusimicrobia bacterium]|nr:hypothetical protein [Elusimicrobiota bacterium]